MHTEQIKRRFSSKATSYEQYAIVQKEMAQRLGAIVSATLADKSVESILEIGCGTGGLTRLIRGQYPKAAYEAIDIAPGMIAQARSNLEQHGLAVSFRQADTEEWVWTQPEATRDLIVSGACFQWLLRPESTIRRLCKLLKPGSPLLFSTFGPNTFCELHDSFARAHASLGEQGVRHGLSYWTTEQWLALLDSAGMESLQATVHKVVLTYPGVLDFLRAVKAVGASASEDKTAGLGRKRLLFAMADYYQRTYGDEKGVRVTYEMLFVSGFRSQ
ncbi:malonyl-ACP O-methyltransferase BioC [Brevibacillus parabrevis]|uniref:malonyl-ACP O-methyltransferase BioC n=1 Tax=Brevibacillus parabrevis TaxID=54914 RepID=UPI002E2382D8|nr:malonyl-ACP O-methyltransferase BioC [Brevibacillus parabrevis]MED2256088.1 malonyl-ACP O-methyltransferase BioC [Brevibacillus parabrevis]